MTKLLRHCTPIWHMTRTTQVYNVSTDTTWGQLNLTEIGDITHKNSPGRNTTLQSESTTWLHGLHTGSLWRGAFWLCRLLRTGNLTLCGTRSFKDAVNQALECYAHARTTLTYFSKNIRQHLNSEVPTKFFRKERLHDLWRSYHLRLSPTSPIFGQSYTGARLMAYLKAISSPVSPVPFGEATRQCRTVVTVQ